MISNSLMNIFLSSITFFRGFPYHYFCGCISDMEKYTNISMPEFHNLVNFPSYVTKNRNVKTNVTNNTMTRRCVMCGKERLCSTGNTTSNEVKNGATINGSSSKKEKLPTNTIIIPRQNKGLCTSCDVTVWIYHQGNFEIKWCKGCKNFKPWAAFGEKGSATKCVKCRQRQRDKYATLKNKSNNSSTTDINSGSNSIDASNNDALKHPPTSPLVRPSPEQTAEHIIINKPERSYQTDSSCSSGSGSGLDKLIAAVHSQEV